MEHENPSPTLENLIIKALDNKEIQDGANRARLSTDFLISNLRDKTPKIQEAATEEIKEYNKLDNEYRVCSKKLHEAQIHINRLALQYVVVFIIILITLIGIWLIAKALDGSYSITYGIVGGFIVVISLGLAYGVYKLFRRNRDYYRASQLQLQKQATALEKKCQIAEQVTERAIIEKGILPELRTIINLYLPSYDTKLTISTAPGLAEVFNPAYEISTEAKAKLHRLIANIPGGSIGIAGPRGAGKTTLLGAFCNKGSTNYLKNRPVLSVMTSAPVKYDSREFILHVFSLICQRTLELNNMPIRFPWSYLSEMQRPNSLSFLKGVSWKMTVTSILLGLFLILSNWLIPNLADEIPSLLIPTLTGFIFELGIFFLLLGMVGSWLIIRTGKERHKKQNKELPTNEINNENYLISEAYGWLREIRFQQSYSSGWGGALKVPVPSLAVEAKVNAAVSLAQNQLSLPEIMNGYRDFLMLASTEYEIIIGIDELDKIEADEQAQCFLNEIKALFGVESCFYLISVSESAMSSFELRGLPFRDVFDSSFDAIVQVDYLDLEKAKHLLRRRVIGVPVPFLDFCHCMSGGLPRDLIRTFRGLFEEHLQSDLSESTLPALCSSLVKSDLKSKLHAVSTAAKSSMLEPITNRLFQKLYKLESLLESADSLPRSCANLLESYKDLLASAPQQTAQQPGPAEVVAKREKIASLITELAVYVYYSVTLLEFFGQENFSREALKNAESSGALDQLARARQFFVISPSIAASAITDFRESYNMDIPQGISTNVDKIVS